MMNLVDNKSSEGCLNSLRLIHYFCIHNITFYHASEINHVAGITGKVDFGINTACLFILCMGLTSDTRYIMVGVSQTT
jgi:hypothetical protein